MLSLNCFNKLLYQVERERLTMQAESEVMRMLTRKANEHHGSFSTSMVPFLLDLKKFTILNFEFRILTSPCCMWSFFNELWS